MDILPSALPLYHAGQGQCGVVLAGDAPPLTSHERCRRRIAKKGEKNMISAGLSNKARKSIYQRDHWRCALCDDNRGIQIHHYCHRSLGGNDTPHNLITLCWRCHAIAHGASFPEYPDYMNQEEIEQACAEYLGDLYAGEWYPYK